MVPRRGFEPLTCPLGGGRAIQLCHRGLIGEFLRSSCLLSTMSHLDESDLWINNAKLDN